jgi:hypothetical protein
LVGLANVGSDTFTVTRHRGLGLNAIDVLHPGDPDPWSVDPLRVRWITADRDDATVPTPPGAGA